MSRRLSATWYMPTVEGVHDDPVIMLPLEGKHGGADDGSRMARVPSKRAAATDRAAFASAAGLTHNVKEGFTSSPWAGP
jgi:hypothetical protein